MTWIIWGLFGALTLYLIQVLRGHLKKKGINLAWYSWLLFIVWYALLVFAVDFVYLSLYEGEGRAAVITGMALGVIILALVPALRKMLKPSAIPYTRRPKEVSA